MVSVMLYPCILCVSLLMDLFVLCLAWLTVFVNCLVKQFAICLGVIVILLLNVIECLVCVEVLCWIDRLWSSTECVCVVPVNPLCVVPVNPLCVPAICFVYDFVCQK